MYRYTSSQWRSRESNPDHKFAKLMRSPNHNPMDAYSDSNRTGRFAGGLLTKRMQTTWLEHSDSNRGSRGLQPRYAYPWLAPAETRGIEPLPLRAKRFSKPPGAQLQRIHVRKVKESNPQPDDWHSFLGCLRTVPRYPPSHEPVCTDTEPPALALSQGFEPQPPGSEPGILPLDEESKWHGL